QLVSRNGVGMLPGEALSRPDRVLDVHVLQSRHDLALHGLDAGQVTDSGESRRRPESLRRLDTGRLVCLDESGGAESSSLKASHDSIQSRFDTYLPLACT